MSVKQNTSPQINISSGSQQVEPLIVGNANTIFRYCITCLVILIGILCWTAVSILESFSTQATKIGTLEEKVFFLEDIVINKTYAIERKG